MRILITGAIGSGKSRLANRMLSAYGVVPAGLRSLRHYDAQGHRSFSLRTLTTAKEWPLPHGQLQTALFDQQVLPALQAELRAAPDSWLLIDEIGKLEAEASLYLAFIRACRAERQVLVLRKSCLESHAIPCDLLLDLDRISEDAALQQALRLFGAPPLLDQTRLILMASGFSRRFQGGSNKLLMPFQGKLLVEHALDLLSQWQAQRPGALALVCARDEAVLRLAHQRGLIGLYNAQAEEGISASIRLGVQFDPGYPVRRTQYIFLPADQPHLRLSTLLRLTDSGAYAPDALISMQDASGRPGSPVLFGADYGPALSALKGEQGGRKVFARYPEKQRFLLAEALELRDYDQALD